MRFEAHSPPQGLVLQGQLLAGFSLGAARLIRVRIQRRQSLSEPDLPLFCALQLKHHTVLGLRGFGGLAQRPDRAPDLLKLLLQGLATCLLLISTEN